MANINTELLRFNGKIGPQYLDKGDTSGGSDGTMKPVEGSDGALHTKIVDHNGNPISSGNKMPVADADVKTELEEIKQQQAQILQRLDDGVDTRLTGSNVEYKHLIKTSDYIQIPSGASVDLSLNHDFSRVTRWTIVIKANITMYSGDGFALNVEYKADGVKVISPTYKPSIEGLNTPHTYGVVIDKKPFGKIADLTLTNNSAHGGHIREIVLIEYKGGC